MRQFIVIAALSLVAQSTSAEVIKVAGDPWCPFTCTSGSPKPGLLIELLGEALGPQVRVEYEEVSWARAVNEARIGRYGAIVGALKGDAPDFIFPETSTGHQRSCFFVAPSSKWSYADTGSFKNQMLGAVVDYTYGEPIDSYIKANNKDETKVDLISGTDTAIRLLKKLRDLRIDVLVEDASVVSYQLSHNKDLLGFGPKQAACQSSQPLYVAFSPKDPQKSKILAEKFTAGLKKLKASGRYKALFKSYGVSL